MTAISEMVSDGVEPAERTSEPVGIVVEDVAASVPSEV